MNSCLQTVKNEGDSIYLNDARSFLFIRINHIYRDRPFVDSDFKN